MSLSASAQTNGSSGERLAATVMRQWPAGVITTIKSPGVWSYEDGVLLDGIFALWQKSRNPIELAYIKASLDRYIQADGSIDMNGKGKAYPAAEHTLDDIEVGRSVMALYRVTHDERYAKTAKFLEEQLAAQPRAASGGYWHKQIYPNQMWLDGAFMAEPFRAAYAVSFHQPADFADIAKQFQLMFDHMRSGKTDLLRHGWDESKAMPWADKETGQSPAVWARAMGWYCAGLVDTLDWLPKESPQRAQLIGYLNRTVAAAVSVQDASGTWWQVLDRGTDKGNFREASASSMFVYAIAKGVRMGYLPKRFEVNARRGWEGIQKQFVTTAPDGTVTLAGTVKVGGLGGNPYRSGTPEYYYNEKTGDQDSKGVGAYLLAASEMDR